MENVSAFVREPKQERSRLSFDKAVDAAVALLVERRSDAFTLAEVAERAGVSTGSIYGRVDSKDDLLRAAQARELARMDAEMKAAFDELPMEDADLAVIVGRAVRGAAEVLRRNAPVLSPFMLLANSDEVIADTGRRSHGVLVEAWRATLLLRRDGIRHPDPERAVDWSLTVVYSVLARWLGLGSGEAAAHEGDWDQIVADLSEMVTAFLVRTRAER